MTLIFPTRPNVYTGSPLDRAVHLREDTAWIAAALADPDTLFAPVWRSRSLMRGLAAGAPEGVFLRGPGAPALRSDATPWAFLGLRAGAAVFGVDISAVEDPAPLLGETEASFEDLRGVAGALPAHDASILAHARGLLHWRSRHLFCGLCGAPCVPASAGNVVHCSACGTHHFPRTDPAVIMLVWRGDTCLLGHSQRFPRATMYSTLAGFVEPGESLEEAVAREVREESGVAVGRVQYHSSQPWPFPASIMLGFYAEGLTEEITIEETELSDARWFSRADLRAHETAGFSLPRRDSIARRLIEDWLDAA